MPCLFSFFKQPWEEQSRVCNHGGICNQEESHYLFFPWESFVYTFAFFQYFCGIFFLCVFWKDGCCWLCLFTWRETYVEPGESINNQIFYEVLSASRGMSKALAKWSVQFIITESEEVNLLPKRSTFCDAFWYDSCCQESSRNTTSRQLTSRPVSTAECRRRATTHF